MGSAESWLARMIPGYASESQWRSEYGPDGSGGDWGRAGAWAGRWLEMSIPHSADSLAPAARVKS